MSKLRTIPYVVLSAGLFAGGSAYAQSMSTIDQRQDYQQDRIERGIRDGQITRSEAYRLEQGERAIDRAQARARADGVVTPQERARIDRMTDRESREIYRDSHNDRQAWDRGQSWGHTDGRNDGWHDRDGRSASSHDGWGRDGDRDGRRDGWGQNRGGDRDGDRGNHYGWNRGEHNGWDNNHPSGPDHRDFADRRDGNRPTPTNGSQPGSGSHNWNGWQHQPQAGNTPPTGTQPGTGSHNWGNWGSRGGNQTPPTTGTQQAGTGSHNWGNWGSRGGNQTPPTTGTQQASNGSRSWGNWGSRGGNQTPPPTGTQQAGNGSRNWGGWHTQQASATPTQAPTMMRASAPSTGTRSSGGRR
jgi:hypothetical protein